MEELFYGIILFILQILVIFVIWIIVTGVKKIKRSVHVPQNTVSDSSELSGICGDLTWTFRDGVLCVRGEGALKGKWTESLNDGSRKEYTSKELMEAHNITRVVITEGCTEIGGEAFACCESLIMVDLPNSLQEIGKSAFIHCGSLTEIVIPKAVTYIGEHCFEGCKNLRTFRWPAQVSEIMCSTFKDCEALEWVDLPKGVSQLWQWSFQNCGNLRHIDIPDSVTRISTTAFCGANLNALWFCSDRFRVKDGCLYSDRSLLCASAQPEEITVAHGTEIIADYAFYRCPNLSRVILPATVRFVEKRAFYGCAELEEIVYQGDPPLFAEEAVLKCGKLQIVQSKFMDRREKLTFQNCCIAVTRNDYATLINGKFRYYPGERGELDITPLQCCHDLVDIKGGFDFIMGLRENGEVVAARKPTDAFPLVEGRWYGIRGISATEGRAAALTTDGRMVHLQKFGLGDGQPIVHVPDGRFRSVAVHFDGIMAIDEAGCMVDLPSDSETSKQYRMAQVDYGVEFAEIACRGYYYTSVTSAALTTDGQVFWEFGGKQLSRFPIGNVVKLAVGRRAVAVVTADHKVYAATDADPEKAVFVCDQALAVNLMWDGPIIVIRTDGTCETFNI